MKRTLSLALSVTLVLSLLIGCTQNNTPKANETVKTGFAVISTAEKSVDASTEPGLAQVDSTIVALTVDKNNKIVKCIIDAIQTKVNFNSAGKITTDKASKVNTKLELETKYGMGKASSIGKEWNEQAKALASYVEGKTIDEVKGIAVNEKGAPTANELKSSVTFSIGGYISAIEKAAGNAQDIGAKSTDKLGFGAITSIEKSKDAAAEPGLAQAYSSYAVATFDANGKITSCLIDGSQTNVTFDSKGKITSDLKAPNKTKQELGTGYGMGKVSSIGKEWNEQANALAKYVTGKTISEVKGIAVNEKGVPTASELKSSVTIAINDQIALLEKASTTAK